jgi:hypothetical protein
MGSPRFVPGITPLSDAQAGIAKAQLYEIEGMAGLIERVPDIDFSHYQTLGDYRSAIRSRYERLTRSPAPKRHTFLPVSNSRTPAAPPPPLPEWALTPRSKKRGTNGTID